MNSSAGLAWRHASRHVQAILRRLGWHGGTIEFLLIDAMKSGRRRVGRVVADVFPGSMPGVSIILHQNFDIGLPHGSIPSTINEGILEPLYDVPASGKHGVSADPASSLGGLNQDVTGQFSNEDIDAALPTH